VSGLGPKAARVAGRIGDGFICTKPDADLVRTFREGGGGKNPAQAGFKVCHAASAAEGLATAHRLWPNTGLPGELSQVLPTPRHFEQASQLVTRDAMAGMLPCGPDPDAYLAAIKPFVDAGFDELYVQQIGPEQNTFFDFWRREIASALR
jgi:G6PDH family F420-dependent oxidoreductase